MERLYLAYGSNLSVSQINERCPDNRAVAAVKIPGYRLAFAGEGTKRWGEGGVATLLMDPDSEAWGALYMLSPEDEARMDGYEGVPVAYVKETDWAGRIRRHEINPGDNVFTYLKRETRPERRPSELYLQTILEGYRDWGLPEQALVPWLSQGKE